MPKDKFLNRNDAIRAIDYYYRNCDPIISDGLCFNHRNYDPMMTQSKCECLSLNSNESNNRIGSSERKAEKSPSDVIVSLNKKFPLRSSPTIFNHYYQPTSDDKQGDLFQQPSEAKIPTNDFFESVKREIKILDLYHIDISEWSEENLKKYNLEEYFDPITFMLILNPVNLSCGCIVDGNERLKMWLADEEATCPNCNKEVKPDEITPNNEAGRIINEGLQRILNEGPEINYTRDKHGPSVSPGLHM